MRISIVLACLLSLSVVSAGNTVSEKYSFVGDKVCLANGQLEFAVTQYKGVLSVKDIKGIGMKPNGTSTYLTVPGHWYDINYKPIDVFKRGEKTIFLSNESFFSEGNYTILLADKNISVKQSLQMDYYSGKNTLEDGSGMQFQIQCPKQKYICKPLYLKIDGCNNTDFGFVAKFSGLQNSGLNLLEDISFYLNYELNIDSEVFDTLPKESQLKFFGNDNYSITIPKGFLKKTVNHLRLVVQDCNPKLYKSVDYKKCAVPRTLVAKASLKNFTLNGTTNITNSHENNIIPENSNSSNISIISNAIMSPKLNGSMENASSQPKVVLPWYDRLFSWFFSLF